MRIRTILTAAAAPAALAAALLGTASQASAATITGPGNSSAISAYYWQPNGHALGGPQPATGTPVPFGSDGLALISEKMHGQNISGLQIKVTGHLNPSVVDYADTHYPNEPTNVDARVWFNGAGGSSDLSPQGYLGQVWWAHPSTAVLDLNNQTSDFTLTVTVAPTSDWSDWNGKGAADDAQQQALFTQAASHVQEMGLSFGGGWFFENGVIGTGDITVTSITAG